MRVTGGCEVRRRRDGEQASRPGPASGPASGAATAVLPPSARSPAAQVVAPGSGREATPQGGAGLQAGLQGLVAYSDSDSDQGDLAQIDV